METTMEHRMEIEFLRHFGFQATQIAALIKAYGTQMLPLQERAINTGKLLEGQSLLVCAPTSSGKTLLAELLFLHHARQAGKTLLLVPTKALANQRYEELQARYAPLGYDVVLSSRDHTRHDSQIREGRFHIAIVIYEKLRALMADHRAWLHALGACVVDEFHYVFNSTRGPNLELLLTYLRRQASLQMLGLSSATVDNTTAHWLQAQRLVEHERPIELRQGVLCGKRFVYKGLNSKETSEERLPLQGHCDPGEAMLEAARYFADQNETTLCFWPRRDLCYQAAQKLAAFYEVDNTLDLQPLRRLEASAMQSLLLDLIPRGVAVHTSDLTADERRAIERYCQSGEVRIICATSTLAEGLNLPVVNVLTTPLMYSTPDSAFADCEPLPLLIRTEQLCNMTGRAGRKGYTPFGRGLIVTHSPADIDGLLALYPTQQAAPLSPVLNQVTFEQVVLHAAGLLQGADCAKITDFLRRTLTGRSGLWPSEIAVQTEQALKTLQSSQLLTCENHRYYPSPIGGLVCQQGLRETSARRAASWVQQLDEAYLHPLPLLLEVCLFPEMMDCYIHVPRRHIQNHTWTHIIEQFFEEHRAPLPPSLGEWLGNKAALRRTHHQAFKKTALLYRWLRGESTSALEKHFHVYIGAIQRLAAEAAWLLACLAQCASAYGLAESITRLIARLSLAVRWGLPVKPESCSATEHGHEGFGWVEYLKTGFLSRSEVLKLLQAGYAGPESIQPEHAQHLQTLLPERYAPLAQHLPWPEEPQHEQSNPPYQLQLDPGRPNRITISGTPITLTQLQSKLLRFLSRTPMRCRDYESILQNVWDNSIGSKKQLSRQKSQIEQKVKQALPEACAPLIETIDGQGLMLNAHILEVRDSGVTLRTQVVQETQWG